METDLLASLIGQKHEVLEKLRQLSRRQSDLIQGADMTGLMNVLAVKQLLINQLTDLEQRLNPFRDQDPDQRVWRSHEERTRCRQMSERCAAMLQEVMLIEKQCEGELRTRRDDVAHRLDTSHFAAEARAAYVDFGHSVPAGQLDLTSER